VLALGAWIALLSIHGADAEKSLASVPPREHESAEARTSVPRAETKHEALGESQRETPSRTRGADASATSAPRSPPRISFRYEDDRSANGLALYRADSLTEIYERAIKRDAAHWTHRLDALGELDSRAAAELGSLVAVRASDDAVELVPFDPNKTREYTLTPLVDQQFRLTDAPNGREFSAEIDLSSADFHKFGSYFDYLTDRIEFLADGVTLLARSPEHLVVAYKRMKLKSAGPILTLKLPRGDYWLSCISCTVGAWMSRTNASVDGTPIDLPLTSVPVTHVLLKRDENGNVRVPQHVRIYVRTKSHDGLAGSSGELELDFEVTGQEMLVNERWRDTSADGRSSQYALKFYWPDGPPTMTPVGDWESLLQTIDLSGS
jgi:hypothetical protein